MMADSGGLSIPDSTGYLGNLETKSSEELRYLLQRQQKIYQNHKFVSKLPDKGQKMKKLIEKIENILQYSDKTDHTSELFEKMAIDAEITSRKRSEKPTNNETEMIVEDQQVSQFVEDNLEESAIRNMANRLEESKQVLDERTNDKQFVNNYAKVISKSEEMAKKHPKFVPGRSLRTKTNTQEDHVVKNHKEIAADMNKEKYYECLEYKSHRKFKFSGAKNLSIEESVQIMQQQQRKNQELLAQNAAEKLSQTFGFKMGTFNPEGSTYTRYRDNTEVDSDDEDDTDAQEQDYPDS